MRTTKESLTKRQENALLALFKKLAVFTSTGMLTRDRTCTTGLISQSVRQETSAARCPIVTAIIAALVLSGSMNWIELN